MNMKSTYLPTLLIFFLLLVNKPVSAGPNLPTKKLELLLKGLEAADPITEEVLKKIKKQDNPHPPSLSPQSSSPGLRYVKAYLYNYGYIQSQIHSPTFTDTMDQDTQTAITNYQSVFKLQTTGTFNTPTFQKMFEQPRCGVPDLNLRYTLNDDNTKQVSWPKGTQWSPNPRSLTYGFDANITNNVKAVKVFRDSFQIWTKATGVKLTETSFNAAQIKVGLYNLFNDQRVEVAASTILLRQAQSGNNNNNNNNFGLIILEDDKNDQLPGRSGKVDLQTVVMHQIGHILGLEHSHDEESIMHPVFYPPQQTKVSFSKGDMQQIRRLSSGQSAGGGEGSDLISDMLRQSAGSRIVGSNNSPTPTASGGGGGRVRSSCGFLVSLSIAFSCLALSYI